MKTKIAIVGRGEFINLARNSTMKFKNSDIEITVFDCAGDLSITLPRILTKLEENETDMVITGHFIKIFLEKRTSIPVIKLKVTPIDILLAIQKSLPFSNKIAIVLADLEELKYDYSILEELLQVQLHYFSYNTQTELRLRIENFSKSKGTIISTGFGVAFAKEYGIKGTLIYSEVSIIASIERAMEIIHFKRAEEKQRQQLKAVIDSVRDGIIATDEQDKITIFNESAWNLLNIEKNNIVGERLLKIVPNRSLREITKDEAFQNKIINFDHVTLNLSKVAVTQKGTKIGNIITLQDISEIQKIEQNYRVEIESKGLVAKNEFKDIIYESKIIHETIERAKKFAKTDSTILITGESGTGKELIAQSIHNHSYRKSYPFVAISCAALPETLLESELFGYEKGAFTGAAKNGKKGLFELAHHGTLFLDEVNSISPHFQARLLRVLQEKEVVRIGGHKVIPVNIRIIAAANENLICLVQENKFRADLYYRLNVLKINLPLLRQRAEDIIPLAKQFIFQNRKELYRQIEPYIEEIFAKLLVYKYPGNVRELYNILERFTILAEVNRNDLDYYKQLLEECIEEIQDHHLATDERIVFALKDNYKDSLIEAEKSIIKKFLDMQKGDRTALAEELGIGRTTLYRKLKELNIR
ncbi:AAA domain-containing protein [Cytobacillus depressus]|uniref:AAA domain-containing protein n=1 Tax=Cytobacillus depressus TaxID=1602942 RepID=A0A6L3V304_9BACI|nr:sigma 54-interacting transcriptional regulator [Cytobacillus depressus]KAB2333320.1 AAA domain-containing protein [Cytobacillus depressus]